MRTHCAPAWWILNCHNCCTVMVIFSSFFHPQSSPIASASFPGPPVCSGHSSPFASTHWACTVALTHHLGSNLRGLSPRADKSNTASQLFCCDMEGCHFVLGPQKNKECAHLCSGCQHAILSVSGEELSCSCLRRKVHAFMKYIYLDDWDLNDQCQVCWLDATFKLLTAACICTCRLFKMFLLSPMLWIPNQAPYQAQSKQCPILP